MLIQDLAMDDHVSKFEFEAKALEYLALVESSGKRLIVTDRGRPILEIRPYCKVERCPLDMLRGTLVRYDDPREPVDDDWESAG